MGPGKFVGIIVCMLVCVPIITVSAQDIKTTSISTDPPGEEWIRAYGGNRIDWGNCVRQTSDGGFIISGTYGRNAWSFWYCYFYVMKTDANGIKQWEKVYGTYNMEHVAKNIQETHDKGFIIAGFEGTGGSYDAVVQKLDASGNLLWSKTFGEPDVFDEAFWVQELTDGGYIVTGCTQSFGANNTDVLLICLDSAGETIWIQTLGGDGNDAGNSVLETADGGFVLVGTTDSSLSNADVWMIKTDANGNIIWSKTFGGIDWEEAYMLQQTDDNGYIIVGTTASFGAGNNDVLLIKTDVNGNEEWTKTFGGSDSDVGYSVQETSDKGYFITGETTNPTTQLPDIYLIKTDTTGDEEWIKTIDNHDGEDHAFFGQPTNDGGYIITGYTGDYIMEQCDAFLIKLGKNGGDVKVDIKARGGFGIKMQITNTGTMDISTLTWTINVLSENGKINKQINGTIPTLAVGESSTVSSGLFFGFGLLLIRVSAGITQQCTIGQQLLIFTLFEK
jgi:hypothetical protein